MTTLKDRITADMKEAMRAKEAVRLEAIRLLRAAIQRREVDERVELDEDEVLAVLQKMIKQGRDSIEQFEKGGRDDLVQKEAATLEVLETYLPRAVGREQTRRADRSGPDRDWRTKYSRHGQSDGMAQTPRPGPRRHGCRQRIHQTEAPRLEN